MCCPHGAGYGPHVLVLALLNAGWAMEPDPGVPTEAGVPAEAPAQTGQLVGRVIALESALPVEGALVHVEGGGTTTTDANGRFTLPLPPGEHTIRIADAAYDLLIVVEEVRPGGRMDVVYKLRPPPMGEEVIVEGERERHEVSRQVFTAEELKEIPGSFGDPVRALHSLPGVARPAALEGNIVVRGAEGLNTGFYIDEMPVPYLFHQIIGKSVINPAFIDDVEFYAGGMPSRFGEVTQAAVNVRTNREHVLGRRGLVDVNLFDGGAALEFSSERWTVRAAARYSWIGGIIATGSGIYGMTQGGDFSEAPSIYPAYWDALVVVENRPAPGRTLSATLLGSNDAIVLAPGRYDGDDDGEPDPYEWEAWDLPYDPTHYIDAGFGRLRLRWQDDGGDHDADTWVATGPQSQQNLLGDLFTTQEGPYNGRVRGWSTIARREDTLQLSPVSRVVLGGQGTITPVQAEDFTNAAASHGEDIPTTEDVQASVGLFGEWERTLGGTRITPGLRGQFYAFNGDVYVEPEPRLTVRHALREDFTLKGFVGRFTQMPPADRYAQGIGNPELPLMSSWQATLGAEWSFGPIAVDTSLYGSLMQDLVVRDMEVRVVNRGGYATTETYPVFHKVEGRSYGWETLIRYRPQGPFWGWVAFTLGRSERIYGTEVFPGDYDQPVSLTLLGAYHAPKRWDVSARFRVTSGSPYTPLLPAYDAGNDSWQAFPGDPNSARFPVFHQLDVRVQKTWQRRRGDWGLYLDLYNAYWANNPFLATYNANYSKMISVISLPILPSLGVEVKF